VYSRFRIGPPHAVVDNVASTAPQDDDSCYEQPAYLLSESHNLSELSNALVQLQAHLTMRAQRAIQKCLSAATFVRPRAHLRCHSLMGGHPRRPRSRTYQSARWKQLGGLGRKCALPV